ncbi:hypothetical protein [Nocardioides speluncae]|uniref:hypothetical protein n=1 Tax=Nocardioides speluncae TaxID=2670337 RepID=UPI0012B164F0|nr:hypothetical protein [Nocardioides speluncae]
MPNGPKELRETAVISEAAAAAAKTSGRMLVQLISPGWGSSGYYAPKVLAEAAKNRIIPAGTHMYADHPTEVDVQLRPERSIRDLMGVTTTDARLSADGALVAEVRVAAPYREFVSDIVESIGVSIRGDATDITEGEAEGRRGRIIEGLAHVQSVDFVTRAGRGGKVLAVLEAARTIAEARGQITENVPVNPAGQSTPKENTMGNIQIEEGEHKALVEKAGRVDTLESERDTQKARADKAEAALAEATKATEEAAKTAEEAKKVAEAAGKPRTPRELLGDEVASMRRELAEVKARDAARDIVTAVLAESYVADETRARLAAELIHNVPLTEAGALDENELQRLAENARDVAETETAAVLKAAGIGTPRGLGALTAPVAEAAAEKDSADLVEKFQALGLSESAAKTAAKGR